MMHEMISVEQDEAGRHRFECLLCPHVIMFTPVKFDDNGSQVGGTSPITVLQQGDVVQHTASIGPVSMLSAEIVPDSG
jgi:hypothetical protein